MNTAEEHLVNHVSIPYLMHPFLIHVFIPFYPAEVVDDHDVHVHVAYLPDEPTEYTVFTIQIPDEPGQYSRKLSLLKHTAKCSKSWFA